MADLNVQPKKKSILPWILLIAGVIALLFFFGRGYISDDTKDNIGIEKDSINNNSKPGVEKNNAEVAN